MRIRYSKPENDINSEIIDKNENENEDINNLKSSLSNKNLITSITSNIHSIRDDESGHEMLVTYIVAYYNIAVSYESKELYNDALET